MWTCPLIGPINCWFWPCCGIYWQWQKCQPFTVQSLEPEYWSANTGPNLYFIHLTLILQYIIVILFLFDVSFQNYISSEIFVQILFVVFVFEAFFVFLFDGDSFSVNSFKLCTTFSLKPAHWLEIFILFHSSCLVLVRHAADLGCPVVKDRLGLAVYQSNPIKEKNKERKIALLHTASAS